jgi:hypothetical protein
MSSLHSTLPLLALGLAAMLGGCVAYPDYPSYGYGPAVSGYYVGGAYGGEHGDERRGESHRRYHDEHDDDWRR